MPESVDLGLRNDAVTIHGTVLYADLDGSTKLVDTNEPWFAAGIYKSYLLCAARISNPKWGHHFIRWGTESWPFTWGKRETTKRSGAP